MTGLILKRRVGKEKVIHLSGIPVCGKTIRTIQYMDIRNGKYELALKL